MPFFIIKVPNVIIDPNFKQYRLAQISQSSRTIWGKKLKILHIGP
jgi:hypothetical protein